MKIVVFGTNRRVGAQIEGDRIVDLQAADPVIPSGLEEFILGGDRTIAEARRAIAAAPAAAILDQASIALRSPQVRGARIACAGGNFADHTAAMTSRRSGNPIPADFAETAATMRKNGIWGFWKVGRWGADPGGEVIKPAITQRFDYEGELAIVIGKEATNVKAAEVAQYVWGITLFADWCTRDVPEPPGVFRFAAAKNFDTSYSMGPCILVDEPYDYANTPVETYVNGDRRQSFSTRDMVFSFGEFLEVLTRDMTFYPGDVISCGTARGTAADSSVMTDGVWAPERFLQAGDSVEHRSPQIGTLSARIVAR